MYEQNHAATLPIWSVDSAVIESTALFRSSLRNEGNMRLRLSAQLAECHGFAVDWSDDNRKFTTGFTAKDVNPAGLDRWLLIQVMATSELGFSPQVSAWFKGTLRKTLDRCLKTIGSQRDWKIRIRFTDPNSRSYTAPEFQPQWIKKVGETEQGVDLVWEIGLLAVRQVAESKDEETVQPGTPRFDVESATDHTGSTNGEAERVAREVEPARDAMLTSALVDNALVDGMRSAPNSQFDSGYQHGMLDALAEIKANVTDWLSLASDKELIDCLKARGYRVARKTARA